MSSLGEGGGREGRVDDPRIRRRRGIGGKEEEGNERRRRAIKVENAHKRTSHAQTGLGSKF